MQVFAIGSSFLANTGGELITRWTVIATAPITMRSGLDYKLQELNKQTANKQSFHNLESRWQLKGSTVLQSS